MRELMRKPIWPLVALLLLGLAPVPGFFAVRVHRRGSVLSWIAGATDPSGPATAMVAVALVRVLFGS